MECIACKHGVPRREMLVIPQKNGYVIMPMRRDHVVRFNTKRLASKLARVLRG